MAEDLSRAYLDQKRAGGAPAAGGGGGRLRPALHICPGHARRLPHRYTLVSCALCSIELSLCARHAKMLIT